MSDIAIINDNNNFAPSIFRSLCEFVGDCFGPRYFSLGATLPQKNTSVQNSHLRFSHNDLKKDGAQLLSNYSGSDLDHTGNLGLPQSLIAKALTSISIKWHVVTVVYGNMKTVWGSLQLHALVFEDLLTLLSPPLLPLWQMPLLIYSEWYMFLAKRVYMAD